MNFSITTGVKLYISFRLLLYKKKVWFSLKYATVYKKRTNECLKNGNNDILTISYSYISFKIGGNNKHKI